MQKQGYFWLKVCGILMIAGGATGILGVFASVTEIARQTGSYNMGWALNLLFIISVIVGVTQLVAGILGVKNWLSPEKAQSCIVIGIVIIVLNVGISIWGLSTGTVSVQSLLISLALPIVYLMSALQLKKQGDPSAPQAQPISEPEEPAGAEPPQE